MPRAKIVCTLGPASSSPERIGELIDAGMNVARLNFSHGTHEDHAKMLATLRAEADRRGKAVAALLNLQGPKIRLGRFASGPVLLEAGAEFIVTTDDVPGDATMVSTTYAGLDSRLLASGLAHGAVVLSLWLAGVAAALGVHAGLSLWAQRPGAVATARRALLWGLALDVAATVLQLLAGTTAFTPSLALDELMVRLLPDLLFFTLCLGYLNKSRRVALTYPAA